MSGNMFLPPLSKIKNKNPSKEVMQRHKLIVLSTSLIHMY